MALKKITITDEHIKLLQAIKFETLMAILEMVELDGV